MMGNAIANFIVAEPNVEIIKRQCQGTTPLMHMTTRVIAAVARANTAIVKASDLPSMGKGPFMAFCFS